MTEPLPEPLVPDETCGWPITVGCCNWSPYGTAAICGVAECAATTLADYGDEVSQRSINLAVMTLRMLTAGRVNTCPVTVRPCAEGCVGGSWAPYLDSQGKWRNGCSCASRVGCACAPHSRLLLPGPIGRVDLVSIGGEELVQGVDYRVYASGLIRTNGTWPACQDLTLPPEGDGVLTVTYVRGYLPDYGAAVAAGRLACEYAKDCTGQDCALPSTVRSMTRQGLSMEFTADAFEGGMTGIREVDAWVKLWNPHSLKTAPAIWSPDMNFPEYEVTQ